MSIKLQPQTEVWINFDSSSGKLIPPTKTRILEVFKMCRPNPQCYILEYSAHLLEDEHLFHDHYGINYNEDDIFLEAAPCSENLQSKLIPKIRAAEKALQKLKELLEEACAE